MKRYGFSLVAFVLLIAASGPLLANEIGIPLTKMVREITLHNGMRFFIVRDSKAPVFSAYIGVKVGGIEEEPGKSGLAHLLEHMAFKGTAEIGTSDYTAEKPLIDRINVLGRELAKATQTNSPEAPRLKAKLVALEKEAKRFRRSQALSIIYQANGAQGLNASTSKDMTDYIVDLPNNRLELWAHLESERFLAPVMREFYLEKDVVIQERRERVDNNPMGKFLETFLEHAFDGSPYAKPTIGVRKELDALTAEDLETFFTKYYTPDRIVVSLVGDLPSDTKLKPLLERTFGRLERPSTPDAAFAPFARTRETIFEMTLPAEPLVALGYLKPTIPSREDTAFEVLVTAFCSGATSPLVQSLVFKQQIASSVDCDTHFPGIRLNNLFIIIAKPFPGVSLSKLVESIDREIDQLKHAPFSKDVLKKARHQLTSQTVWALSNPGDLAENLASYELLAGDWRYLTTFIKTIQSVDAKELQKLATTYLDNHKRVVGYLKSPTP